MPTPEFINKRIIKAFQHIPFEELSDAPVVALRGVGKKAEELLAKSFNVKTVGDLANLKYISWAQEILALEKTPQDEIEMEDFEEKLIKKFEATPIKKLIQSPVYALQGLSEADGKRMQQGFNVKTIRDLASLKYAKFAQEICSSSESFLTAPAQVIEEPDSGPAYTPNHSKLNTSAPKAPKKWIRLLFVALFFLIVFLLWYFFCRSCTESDKISNVGVTQPIIKNSVNEVPVEKTTLSETSTSGSDDASKKTETTSESSSTDLTPGKPYTIQKEDTLYSLSRRAYGDPKQWIRIYKANPQMIKNPRWIREGTIVNIPAKN